MGNNVVVFEVSVNSMISKYPTYESAKEAFLTICKEMMSEPRFEIGFEIRVDEEDLCCYSRRCLFSKYVSLCDPTLSFNRAMWAFTNLAGFQYAREEVSSKEVDTKTALEEAFSEMEDYLSGFANLV